MSAESFLRRRILPGSYFGVAGGFMRGSVSTGFNIHPDFQSIKGRALSLRRWPLALMCTLLATVNAFHRRKFKAIVTTEHIASRDGYRVPVLIVRPENLPQPSPALI
jgi:hypothetical protein